MRHNKQNIFNLFIMACMALSACTTPTSPTSPPLTNETVAPPPLLYITKNQLYEKQPDGTTSMIAALGEEGRVLDALRVKDLIFVLREKGLQRVEINNGKTIMSVKFDKIPLWGELNSTSNDNVLLYSTALDTACSSTGIGATVGLYQIDQDDFTDVFVKDEGYVHPLGLSPDEQSIYALPVGCDPEFDRFWMISTDQGRITKELLTWDASSREYGEGYATLSSDAQFLAFLTLKFIEISPHYRLSVYDLANFTIERFELPNHPSYTGELLWSPTSEELYFILNPGTPYDDSTETYGIFSFDIHTHAFLPVAKLGNRFMHLKTISPDGQWIVVQPEMEQSVTYVYLPTGEQFVINLPLEGEYQIVR